MTKYTADEVRASIQRAEAIAKLTTVGAPWDKLLWAAGEYLNMVEQKTFVMQYR